MQQPVLWSRGPQLLKPLRLEPETREAAAMRSPQLEKAAPTRYNWRKPVCSNGRPSTVKKKKNERNKERKKKNGGPCSGEQKIKGFILSGGVGCGGVVSQKFS